MFQFLALGLLGMSCDEVAMIHEHLGIFVNKHFFKIENLKSEWVVLLGPIVFFVIVVFVIKSRKYLKDSNVAKKFLIIGAFIYIFGAFGIEASINFLSDNALTKVAPIATILEEFCEIIGIVLVIKGLVEHSRFLEKNKGVIRE